MATKEENQKELHRLAIHELHRVYDGVVRSFDHLKTKALALLAGEAAIVTFLFSSNGTGSSFFQKGTSVPTYGFVLFGVGITLLVGAFIIFIHVISIAKWTHPPDEKDLADIYGRFNNSPLEFLEHMKSEYTRTIPQCISILGRRSVRFMWGVYSLSVGIALLVLVKYCSGIIKL